MSTRGLILEGLADKKYLKLSASIRKKANSDLSSQNIGNYHKNIPMNLISDILKKYQLVLLQEDGTEFEGFFCGKSGHCMIDVGFLASAEKHDGWVSYTPIENTCLYLSWYTMESGKYEIVTYLS